MLDENMPPLLITEGKNYITKSPSVIGNDDIGVVFGGLINKKEMVLT